MTSRAVVGSVATDGRAWLAARYRWLRHVPDRLRHRRRHRAALAAIAAAQPTSVLVVCYGNVCRSPYLEAAIVRELPPALRGVVRVSSAGFVGPGRPVPDASFAAAAGRDVALAAHRSRLLTRELVGESDLVLVMSEEQAARLVAEVGVPGALVIVAGDLDPRPIATRTIRDPWGREREVFDEVFDRLDRCARALVGQLRPRNG